jgi:uncharacterized membrane protein
VSAEQATGATGAAGSEVAFAMEAAIGRLLLAGTWLAMALLAVGVALTLTTGVDPLNHGGIPPYSIGSIPAAVVALKPEGFLWAGVTLLIALPIGRVIVGGIGFLAARDLRLALISLLVLLVVLVSVAAAIGLEG